MRVKPNNMELVRVPLSERGGEEEVIQILRGRTRSKRGPRGERGLISDVTGGFRIAVREAKTQ